MSKLKIKPEHLAELREKIESYLADNPSLAEKYETGQFPRSSTCVDVNVRFAWDAYWSCGFDRNVLPSYLDDKHISNAIWTIVPKITRRY